MVVYLVDCQPHCSLCYNETQCYECTHGYYIDPDTASGCMSKSKFPIFQHYNN